MSMLLVHRVMNGVNIITLLINLLHPHDPTFIQVHEHS